MTERYILPTDLIPQADVSNDETINKMRCEQEQYKEGFHDGYVSFAHRFYSAFREHYKQYSPDALVKMGTVVDLIRNIKDEVYEK